VLLASYLLILKKFNLTVALSIWLVGVLISFVIALVYLKKETIFFFRRIKKLNIKILKKALSFSLPLVPTAACTFLIVLADRYIINYFKDATSVAIYSVAYGLVTIILSFSSVINAVIYPYIAKAWGNKQDHQIFFNALLKYTLIITLPAMIGLSILRKQIITLISGPNYLAGSSTIVILIFYPLFASLIAVYSNDLLLREKTILLSFIYLSGATLNIILNFLLIPLYNINGAAIATIITYVFMFLCFYLISGKQISWNFEFLRITRIIAASLLMGFALILINPQIYITKVIAIVLGAAVYLVFLFLFNIFVKEEYSIMKSLLPKYFQKFFK
jgi:O-antigen/teichoic acid export membrane protein